MRKSGILLPISSLPSPHGIGTLGKAAYTFVDFLAAGGQSYWQMLPTGPTGFGDSPYQSFSAMAGNPYFIDLDLLASGGFLTKAEIGGGWGECPDSIDYGLLFEKRFLVLAKAAARQNKTAPEYLAFCQKNAFWLDDYALFMAIKEAHGNRSFHEWPDDLRQHKKAVLKSAEAQWGPRAEFWRCVQFFFFQQWAPLKAYANAQGIYLVGDIPIYISPDSSDLWAHPELFQLDEEERPTAVAGVPPDAFSADGQLWGNPLYNWKEHKKTKYAWWVQRMAFMALHFDWIRIDHFRGFAGYFSVPAGETTARNGEWRRGPGKDFIHALHKYLPDVKIIAEDLGFLTDEVHELLHYSGYPGMKILQFAFDSRDESDYLPHNYPRHTVVYTGTHDNTTTEDWQHSALQEDVAFARKYLGISTRTNITDSMIRTALSSVADTAVLPMQDWLRLGREARINTPSTLGNNNWCWRLLPGQISGKLAARIREQTRLYGRMSRHEKAKDAKTKLCMDEHSVYGKILRSEKSKAVEKESIMHAFATEAKIAANLEKGLRSGLRVLTALEMHEAEDAAAQAGHSYEALMENAGKAAAQEIVALPGLPKLGRSALLLCGHGNNAGDAFVVGRLLAAKGWAVEYLLLAGEAFSPLAELNLARMPAKIKRVLPETANFSATVLVDGVFGTGFHGELPQNIAAVFDKANTAAGIRVALDVPSGLNCDTGEAAKNTFRAALTLTFGAYKPGLLASDASPYYGEVRCLDIGL